MILKPVFSLPSFPFHLFPILLQPRRRRRPKTIRPSSLLFSFYQKHPSTFTYICKKKKSVYLT